MNKKSDNAVVLHTKNVRDNGNQQMKPVITWRVHFRSRFSVAAKRETRLCYHNERKRQVLLWDAGQTHPTTTDICRWGQTTRVALWIRFCGDAARTAADDRTHARTVLLSILKKTTKALSIPAVPQEYQRLIEARRCKICGNGGTWKTLCRIVLKETNPKNITGQP